MDVSFMARYGSHDDGAKIATRSDTAFHKQSCLGLPTLNNLHTAAHSTATTAEREQRAVRSTATADARENTAAHSTATTAEREQRAVRSVYGGIWANEAAGNEVEAAAKEKEANVLSIDNLGVLNHDMRGLYRSKRGRTRCVFI